ncbi:MAG TPA: hypothetical protein VGQ44_04075 [Gemmatimonadaceae bacterium]|jgi:hypothetical protein|nr:hypothetical protein [Gemmatimonadaceae bacterium]
MKEDRFEALMRDAARTYRKPPQPDLDGMWSEIERETWGVVATTKPARIEARWLGTRASGWLAAATLVIGIGLGRASTMMKHDAAPAKQSEVAMASVSPVRQSDTAFDAPYNVETSQYLGQTAALLIALPSETRSGHPDDKFVGRAAELLTRTRLLLDSPAANDTQMRALLEDLELVLAQVVRLQNGQNGQDRTELDLINRALEQRDVIPRLRTAVADISAN